MKAGNDTDEHAVADIERQQACALANAIRHLKSLDLSVATPRLLAFNDENAPQTLPVLRIHSSNELLGNYDE